MKRKVIIVGSGLAGLYLAGCLDESNEVTLLCENDYFNSNSYLAKGGVAIPLNDQDAEQHVRDTLVAGDGLCDPAMVEQIINEGRKLISDLATQGFVFDQSISREGGHATPRVRHVGDETGRYLVEHIRSRILSKPNIRIQSGYAVTDLLFDNNRCYGVVAYSSVFGHVKHIYADAVVIAGGGSGSLYLRNTGNGFANGEMIALAHRYGAEVKGMEFIQFHPTMVYQKGSNSNMLVTEALRGSGAVLEDKNFGDIMHDVHPMGSLAPRDIVSRTVYRRMMQDERSFVWLNYANVSQREMKERFPSLLLTCIKNGFAEQQRIPVTPAAHYTCGGLSAGINGKTSIAGLYAIGEAAYTGLHGANRLASNSLLELLVMASHTAQALNEERIHTTTKADHEMMMNEGVGSSYVQRENFAVQTIMWRHFGIIRSVPSMMTGLNRLHTLKEQLSPGKSFALNRMSNRVDCALLIAKAALSREESVGCHFIANDLEHDTFYATSSVSHSA